MENAPDAHMDKALAKSISLLEADWAYADERAKELKLPRRSARSDYFRLLVDLDRKFKFSKHPHHSDGDWHLYEEAAQMDAEAPGTYATRSIGEAATKALKEQETRRNQPATHEPHK